MQIITIGNCQAQRLGQYISELNAHCSSIFIRAANILGEIPPEK